MIRTSISAWIFKSDDLAKSELKYKGLNCHHKVRKHSHNTCYTDKIKVLGPYRRYYKNSRLLSPRLSFSQRETRHEQLTSKIEVPIQRIWSPGRPFSPSQSRRWLRPRSHVSRLPARSFESRDLFDPWMVKVLSPRKSAVREPGIFRSDGLENIARGSL